MSSLQSRIAPVRGASGQKDKKAGNTAKDTYYDGEQSENSPVHTLGHR
jgi:hypothetical protein